MSGRLISRTTGASWLPPGSDAEVWAADIDSVGSVGFVRNVVPAPDSVYAYPTPWAHVPVLAVDGAADPVVDGEWIDLERARDALGTRHWWPVVEHRLTAPR